MKILNQYVCSVLLLSPFAIPAIAMTAAENTAPEDRSCEMSNDVTFNGDPVTVKRCTAWGFEVSEHVWKHRDARIVCITTDAERQRFYANEEDDFIVQCADIRPNAS